MTDVFFSKELGPYTVYDLETGEIITYGHMPGYSASTMRANFEAQGKGFLAVEGSFQRYVDPVTLEVKPKRPSKAVQTGTRLTNLPVPCRLGVGVLHRSPQGMEAVVQEQWHTVDSGEVDLSLGTSATYRVTVISAQFQVATFDIGAP